MIEELGQDYPIRELCALLQVSRSGYYGWRHGQEPAREAANRQLVEQIQRIYRQTQHVKILDIGFPLPFGFDLPSRSAIFRFPNILGKSETGCS